MKVLGQGAILSLLAASPHFATNWESLAAPFIDFPEKRTLLFGKITGQNTGRELWFRHVIGASISKSLLFWEVTSSLFDFASSENRPANSLKQGASIVISGSVIGVLRPVFLPHRSDQEAFAGPMGGLPKRAAWARHDMGRLISSSRARRSSTPCSPRKIRLVISGERKASERVRPTCRRSRTARAGNDPTAGAP